MKNINIYDKASFVILGLNVLSLIAFKMPAGTIWAGIFIIFIYYGIFMWLFSLLGIAFNVVSIIEKSKEFKYIWINVLMIVFCIMSIPLWKYLFDVAMSV